MSLRFEKKESDEIKPVIKFFKDGDEFLHKCPHCSRIRGIENEFGTIEALTGEQYQDNLCDGLYEISRDAVMVNAVEDL